jgi:hypothetical protein
MRWSSFTLAAVFVAAVSPAGAAGSPSGVRQSFVNLRGKVVSVGFAGGVRLGEDHGVDCVGRTFVTLMAVGENNDDLNDVYVQLSAVRSVARVQPDAEERSTESEWAGNPHPSSCAVDSLSAALQADRYWPYRLGLTTGHVVAIGVTKVVHQSGDRITITFTTSGGGTGTATVSAASVAFVQGERPAK